jgi:glycosyltransferase involved in cell wall biosynthesis
MAPPKKTASKSKAAPSKLPWAKHVICFWKQNDLGLYGRRPDRWIEYWRQHPRVEKVLVFEPPLIQGQLQEMLRLATTLDKVSATEYQLLLEQVTQKLVGKCDDTKVKYCTYLNPTSGATNISGYLRWVIEKTKEEEIQEPLMVLWPACFANELLVNQLAPSHLLVDLVDDQRLFPGNESQHQTITDQYKNFISLGRQVVSNSAGLIDSFSREFGRPVDHLPNALLPMLPLDKNIYFPIERQNSRPVVGYVGNLRGRIDVDTLMAVMQKHPEWDFWFVGQTHRSSFYQRAKSLSNVKFWGTLNYKQANSLMSQFDVAIIPFMENSLVNSMSPIKLDDYKRTKRSVIVLDAKNKKDFESKILEALNKEN